MTYTTAMSERTMQEIVEEITQGVEQESDSNRPDLAIIFQIIQKIFLVRLMWL